MDTFLVYKTWMTPKDFFNEEEQNQKVVYKRMIKLILLMNIKAIVFSGLYLSQMKEMEPVMIELQKEGKFKEFEPSLSETFAYVLKGAIIVRLGKKNYFAKEGEAIYFHSSEEHQIINDSERPSKILLVATESYL